VSPGPRQDVLFGVPAAEPRVTPSCQRIDSDESHAQAAAPLAQTPPEAERYAYAESVFDGQAFEMDKLSMRDGRVTLKVD
jgi:hypothetical protein